MAPQRSSFDDHVTLDSARDSTSASRLRPRLLCDGFIPSAVLYKLKVLFRYLLSSDEGGFYSSLQITRGDGQTTESAVLYHIRTWFSFLLSPAFVRSVPVFNASLSTSPRSITLAL